MPEAPAIHVYGAREHNLKNVNVIIPVQRLTVMTGVSGSGKSSLAFDTIFAEGQRRYMETLSLQARQLLEQMSRPDLDRIEGLSPTIAIDQRAAEHGPRATVATTTEIHDYLRLLFARAGQPHCWICGAPISRQSVARIVDSALDSAAGKRMLVLAPILRSQSGSHEELLAQILKQGFVRARIDGEIVMLDQLSPLNPQAEHTIEVVVDRIVAKPAATDRLAESIEMAARLSGGRIVLLLDTESPPGELLWFSTTLACPNHPEVKLDEISPQMFSFNSPRGACDACHGLGSLPMFDDRLIMPNRKLSLAEGAIAPWTDRKRQVKARYREGLERFCQRNQTRMETPLCEYSEEALEALLFDEPGGIIPALQRELHERGETARNTLRQYQTELPCSACHGARLRPESLAVRIDGSNIAELCALNISEMAQRLEKLHFTGEAQRIARPLTTAIASRLRYLHDAGAAYLTLDRASSTLSDGEAQRIRLAGQLGSGLSGVCYVLDEPTRGLHTRDSRQLAAILRNLVDLGNTVIVVEHDEEIIRASDHMIEIGPGPGDSGGRIVDEGPTETVLASSRSTTARCLSDPSAIPLPERRRTVDREQAIELTGASGNNLRHVAAHFPLGCLIAVTGVSGSGKSTLVTDTLVPAVQRSLGVKGRLPAAFDEIRNAHAISDVIEVDQSAIGRTPRSTPATYVGAFDHIRQLYAKTREAKVRGYTHQRFSFNVKGGRCEECQGQGVKRVEMHFLPDMHVRCDACGGTRFKRETLDVRYRGKNIADALGMLVAESVQFFDNIARIRDRLRPVEEVGLGYLALGQPSNTLSGGEAQRIKLAAALHKSSTDHALYVLNEPTTGMHFCDVENLLRILNQLVDRGHTVLVIEHHLDVIKCADWVIDLGPEGGDGGGWIVAQGTPEEIARTDNSITGRFLREKLQG